MRYHAMKAPTDFLRVRQPSCIFASTKINSGNVMYGSIFCTHPNSHGTLMRKRSPCPNLGVHRQGAGNHVLKCRHAVLGVYTPWENAIDAP